MLIFLLYLLPLAICDGQIKTASRRIDLKSQITVINYEFQGVSGVQNEFVFPIDKIYEDKIAFFSAEANGEPLEMVLSNKKMNNYSFFAIRTSLDSFTAKLYLFKSQVPKPLEVLQAESQYLKFTGNQFILSPYIISSQTTEVNLDGNIIMYTAPEKPATKSSQSLKFGPYTSKSPFSDNLFTVQYEMTAKLLTITKMIRSIEVSHWGNIAIEEDIEIINTGPALKGPFSRLEYMHGIGLDKAARSWTTLLPASAKDVYYRDLIGNVSTSRVDKLYSAVELEVTPRFPLMGGWRTRYTIGYNVPAYEYLYKDGSNFMLKMRVIDNIHKAQFVEDFTLKIILPEAITNLKLETPFKMDRELDSKMPSYLDTTGREVITLHAKNLIDQHIQDFKVSYHFTMLLLVREFLFAIGGFLTLFMAIIIYVRLDFSVSKNAQKESSLRTQALVNDLISEHDKRKSCYQRYETSLSNYKVGKNYSKFNNEIKTLDEEREIIKEKVALIREKMRALWSEGSEKLQELQELDRKYREIMKNLIQVTENFINARVEKKEFRTQETDLNSKMLDLVDKMNTIVSNL